MYFLSEIIREFCLCPHCGAELQINEFEDIVIDDTTLLTTTLCSKCSSCDNEWEHTFNIDFTEKQSRRNKNGFKRKEINSFGYRLS